MARIAFYPNSSGTPFIPGKTYQIPEGGTGATTVADALIALGGISKATAGQVGGPVALDALAYAPVSCYPTGVGQSYTFTGPTALSGGATSSNTYTLTNYDAYTTYTLTPLSGSINSTSNGAGAVTLGAGVSTFTYIPPLRGTGTDGFKITTSTDSTGRSFSVTVNNSVVTTPSISMAFTTNLSEYPTITGSSYGGGTNTLSGQAMTKSRWQIASDSGFTTVLKDKSVTGTATSYTLVSADGALAHGTTYYARVQYACTYNGTDIWSDWSTGVAISTMAEFTLSVPSTNPPIGGQANTLTIQNYDSAATYSVSTSSGCSSVTVSGSTVNFTPNTAGTSYSITISDGHTGITQSGAVTASVVNTPSIASGVTNGQTGLGSSVTMVGSTPSGTGIYSTISSYTATWNLYTNSSYTGTPTTQTVSNATSVTFSGLSANTTYYAQVQYSVGTGVSSFSHGSGSAFSFTTKSSFNMTGTQVAVFDNPTGVSQGFAYAVSIASNGTSYTAIVGAYNFDTGIGKAYIYTNSSGSWTSSIILTGEATNNWFGWSVAIASNGSTYTAIVGAYGYNSGTGKAYIYTNSSGSWTRSLVLTGEATGNYFGQSVAIASDGSTYTAIVGAYVYSSGTGRAYIYTNSSGSWTSSIILTGGATSDYFGYSVAIAYNGSTYTAIVGAHGYSSSTGRAYIYSNSSGSWSATPVVTMTSGATGNYFGNSVAIASNGSTYTAIVGAYKYNNWQGSAYIYSNSGGSWSATPVVTMTGGAYDDYFGNSVAIASDGSTYTAIVGAYGYNSGTGRAYIYSNSGGSWSATPVVTVIGDVSSSFGYSVAIVYNGSTYTAIVGAYGYNGNRGRAYIYT